MAIFDMPTAQALLHKDGAYDGISIQAKEGTSPHAAGQGRGAARAVLAAGRRRQGAGRGGREGDQQGMDFIRYFFLGFGAIALFVGSFVIFNTLSITVAQRTREFATLRTLGASRKQVMRSVDHRGLRDRPARLGGRPGRRPRDLQGPRRAVRRDRRRSAQDRHGAGDAHDRRVAAGRHERHAAGEHPARPARHAGAADRGRPRGRRAPAVAGRRRTRRSWRSA